MPLLPITDGTFATVDSLDLFINGKPLVDYRWAMLGDKKVKRHVGVSVWDGKAKTKRFVMLHRVIMDAPAGMDVDHKDGDTRNNRKSNLRICTRQQNQFNSIPPKIKNGSSKYKGVSRVPSTRTKPWMARLMLNGKNVKRERFDTEIEAAIAYDNWAAVFQGDFAWLNSVNFPADFTPSPTFEATV